MSSTRWFLAFAPLALIAACGGQSFTEGDDDASGGSSAGKAGSGSGGSGKAGSGNAGTSNAGTGSGGTGSGGSGFAGSGTGGSVCCTAAPVCPSGEREVPSSEYCAPGGACHSVSVCCSTIWCTADVVQCDAFPTCDPLDVALTVPCERTDMPCYSRTLCGQTIFCLDQDKLCEPETAHNRKYIATDCSGLDWECSTPQTKSFENDCGCGCEQAEDCPAHLGCVNLMAQREQLDPIPGTGGSSSSALPNPGGSSGVAAGPPCMAEDLARCPYSATY